MDCLNGYCYVVGGTIEPDESRRSFVYKFDDNTLSSTSWTNNPTYLDLTLTSSNPQNSLLTDVIVETNELVVVGLEKTQGDAFASGDNFGIGKIGKIDLNGSLTQIELFDNIGGIIGAFDLKIGLTKTIDQGYALVTSVPGSYNFSTSQNQQVILDYKNSIAPSNCSNAFGEKLTWNTDTYVAKFDQNLNKLWETSFDSDDKDPENYPGDIKKQECMYNIAEDDDGRLFVVGNSSHNADDYYAALLESDCQSTVTYDYPLTNPAPAVPNEHRILPNTIETWNSPKKVKGIIRVYENALLRIENTTVEIANSATVGIDTKFIIEKGGRIEIVNSTLTCVQSCSNQFWDGITILGEKWVNQTNTNQGSILIDNSTIEYAKEALIPGDYFDWNFNGGIITAINSTFKNNNRSVQYLPYKNKIGQNSPELNNVGSFTNCTFTWDDDFLNDTPQPAITMFGTKGVSVRGCTFDDQRSATIPLESRARGVFTIDAGYFVNGKTSGVPPTHAYYSTSNYDVGEFINMYKGIENLNGGSLKPFVVDHVRFLNCQYGVIVRGTDNAIITRNEFNYSDNSAPYNIPFLLPVNTRFALTIDGALGYKIEGNHFYDDNDQPEYGCWINNSGIEETMVRKNKFDSQTFASSGSRLNRNNNPNQSKGLQFLCNTNTDNGYDLYNYSTSSLEGIKLSQGSPSQAALNSVTQTLQLNYHNFRTNDLSGLKYYYNTNVEIPVTSGFVSTFPAPSLTCPSSLNLYEIALPHKLLKDGKRQEIENEVASTLSSLDALQTPYAINLSAGNAPSLHSAISTITTSSAPSVRSSLLNASPYLSLSIMTELGEVPSSIFSKAWYLGLILDNAELMENEEFRNFLVSKTEPLNQGELDGLMNETRSIVTLRGEDRAEIGVLTNQLEQQRNDLLADFLVSEDQQDQNDLPQMIVDRGHYAQRAELVDFWLGQEEYTNASNELNELSNELNNMPYVYINNGLQDFITFKTYLLNKLILNNAFLAELTQTDLDELIGMREDLTGKASLQASNLLCFYAGICQELEPLEVIEGKSQMIIPQANTSTALVKKVNYDVFPNPTENAFVIKGTGETIIQQVEIFNLMGQKVDAEIALVSKLEVLVNIAQQQKGVYLVRIQDEKGTFEIVRLIKN